MRAVFLFVMMIIFAVLQTVLRSVGINFPLMPLLIFYAAYVYGPAFGFLLALPAALLVDFSGGWPHPWSIVGYLLSAGLAVFWLHRIESDSLLLLTVPGGLLPLIGDLPQNLLAGGLSLENLSGSLADALANGLLGAILFPFWIILLDFLGKRIGLQTYGEAGERHKREKIQ